MSEEPFRKGRANSWRRDAIPEAIEKLGFFPLGAKPGPPQPLFELHTIE